MEAKATQAPSSLQFGHISQKRVAAIPLETGQEEKRKKGATEHHSLEWRMVVKIRKTKDKAPNQTKTELTQQPSQD